MDSSWMVIIYSLPIFLSYAIVYKVGIFYYAAASMNILPFCLIASSLGGLIYMTLCTGFIGLVVVLEAGPVYSVFMTGIRGARLPLLQWVWLAGSFLLVFIISLAAVLIPMQMGEKRILQDEMVLGPRIHSRNKRD
jgi:ABC-2 type transport system permease protein